MYTMKYGPRGSCVGEQLGPRGSRLHTALTVGRPTVLRGCGPLLGAVQIAVSGRTLLHRRGVLILARGVASSRRWGSVWRVAPSCIEERTPSDYALTPQTFLLYAEILVDAPLIVLDRASKLAISAFESFAKL